jgi:hypothetical protein
MGTMWLAVLNNHVVQHQSRKRTVITVPRARETHAACPLKLPRMTTRRLSIRIRFQRTLRLEVLLDTQISNSCSCLRPRWVNNFNIGRHNIGLLCYLTIVGSLPKMSIPLRRDVFNVCSMWRFPALYWLNPRHRRPTNLHKALFSLHSMLRSVLSCIVLPGLLPSIVSAGS